MLLGLNSDTELTWAKTKNHYFYYLLESIEVWSPCFDQYCFVGFDLPSDSLLYLDHCSRQVWGFVVLRIGSTTKKLPMIISVIRHLIYSVTWFTYCVHSSPHNHISYQYHCFVPLSFFSFFPEPNSSRQFQQKNIYCCSIFKQMR